MKKLLPLLILLFIASFLATPVHSQEEIDSTKLTIDRIFASGEFRMDYFGPYEWLGDGEYYTTLEPSDSVKGRDIIKYRTKDAEKSISRSKAEAQREAFLKKQAKARFETLDSNHDGEVSRQEYLAPAENRFTGADANNDGVLSEKEFGDAWVDQMEGIRKGFRKKN